jgi:hypothetical protein
MILEGYAAYWGLSDTVEVVAWVEDDDGNDIYKQVERIQFELLHTDTVMFGVVGDSTHYTKEIDESKGCFRSLFIHPPIQYHQYVRVTVDLKDGQTARMKKPVVTEKMLRRNGKELSNPSFGGRGPIHYPLPIEEEQK